MKLRKIRCSCGETVNIPFFWILGIEGIFYCPHCRKYYKINFVLGAFLAGLGWALALATIQLIAYFTSAYTVLAAGLCFVPLGIFYAFVLRRMLLRLTRRKVKHRK